MNIKDVLHYYIGQQHRQMQVKYSGLKWGAWQLLRPLHLTTISGDVQLALKPLSAMMDDDIIGLLLSMVPDGMPDKPSSDDYSIEIFHNDGGLIVDNDVAIGANFECFCASGQIDIRQCGTVDYFDNTGDRAGLYNLPRAYHYLLQQGYDLFGLIENGQAVDVKTIQQ